MTPLFVKLLIDDVPVSINGFRDNITEIIRLRAKLKGKGSKERLRTTSVSLAASKEKAPCKTLLLVKPRGNCSRNGGFSCAS
jgi:hypothetical protein